MASIESVREELLHAAQIILVLMQEGDTEAGFTNIEWADEMFDAYENVHKAINCLNRAQMEDR